MGLSVLGPSIEDLRQQSLLLSDTKTKTLLSVHLVQRIVGSILETLERLHYHRFIHCGLYFTPFQKFTIYQETYAYYFNIAVTPDNICTSVFQRKVELDPILAKLPPCTIERKVIVDSVEYPIVLSQPIPHNLNLNDTHMDTGFYLNNFGHGTLWSSSGLVRYI